MDTATPQDLRVGDTEREAAAARLADHFAAGRLTAEEHAARVSAALTARTRGDLAELMADLPHQAPAVAGTTEVRTQSARDDVARRAVLLWRVTGLVPWAVMAVVFVVIWALTGAGYFWPVWPIAGWGIGVLGTGLLAHRLPEEFLRRRELRGRAGCR